MRYANQNPKLLNTEHKDAFIIQFYLSHESEACVVNC